MRKSLAGFATVAAVLAALAGTSDVSQAQGAEPDRAAAARPAPANVAFGGLRTIYVASGVTDSGGADNTGVATSFHCTNVSGATAQIRFMLLNFDGTVAAPPITVNVGHGVTHTKSTHGAVQTEDLPHLAPGVVIDQGVVNIESNQSAVFCSAMIVDASNVINGNALHLTRVNPDPGAVNQAAANRAAPSNVAFGGLRTIYVASGVADDGGAADAGRATAFLCSNASGVTARIRYLVLQFNGTIAASLTVDVPHAQTHTASTHSTLGFREDADLATGAVSQGVVNIEADQSSVFCSAMVVNAGTSTPGGLPLHRTRVNATPATLD
jgi:hypothetical protein